MPHRFALVAALIILFGACGPEAGDDVVDTTDVARDTSEVFEDTPPHDPSTVSEPSGSLGISLQALLDGARRQSPGPDELAILDRLNEPLRVSIDTQRNRHQPSQVDTLRTHDYDGLELTVYHVAGGKELMKNVTVTGSGLETPQGISIGMSRTDVENVLGAPAEREDGAHVYERDGPMPTRLYVHFDGDRVSEIEWRFPID